MSKSNSGKLAEQEDSAANAAVAQAAVSGTLDMGDLDAVGVVQPDGVTPVTAGLW